MIDINFFAKKAAEAKPDAHVSPGERRSGNGSMNARPLWTKYCPGDITQELPALKGAELHVTHRGIVNSWQLDHMNHMNMRHYAAAFDEASWALLALISLDSSYFQRHRRGMAAQEQTIQYKSELRVGDAFEIRSRVLEVREKTIRLQHDMHK